MKNNNLKKEIFDKEIIEISKRGENNKLLNRHTKILNLIYQYCDKNDYILDIGCFDGKILKTLESKGYKNLYGLDFSEKSRKSFIKSKINFASYNIENDLVPFKYKFDAIIYTDVLEHLFSPEITLCNIKKNLNDKGKIFFSVPNAGWFINGILLSLFPSKLFISTAFGPWSHSYSFTFYQIKKMAQELGFKIMNLSGGRMDNYAFDKGIKKMIYELFLILLFPFTFIFPEIFSDHIFGIFESS
jgi:2-polyprenyl-3-methyl-5-hydroxy-6-metoxy-1,4-benzoquinol methylase